MAIGTKSAAPVAPTLAAELVRSWAPPIFVSSEVTGAVAVANFLEQANQSYVAPEIRFSEAEPLIAGGPHFAVSTQAGGLCHDSIHTLGRHDWHQLFAGVSRTICPVLSGSSVPIIAGNAGGGAYYHWVVETIASMLVARVMGLGGQFVVPALTQPWQHETLALFGTEDPLMEVTPDTLVVLDRAARTNLTGRACSFAPHPAVLATLRERAKVPSRSRGRRVYVGRFDVADRRQMENEADLAGMLASRGFEIVTPGKLPVVEQAALFRSADLIVAPHGGALTNLVVTEDGAAGPCVIELMQETYLMRTFLKIAQAKQLNYRAIISPALPQHRGDHHATSWRCDLDLVGKVIDGL